MDKTKFFKAVEKYDCDNTLTDVVEVGYHLCEDYKKFAEEYNSMNGNKEVNVEYVDPFPYKEMIPCKVRVKCNKK